MCEGRCLNIVLRERVQQVWPIRPGALLYDVLTHTDIEFESLNTRWRERKGVDVE